jgi:hypothetical protein
MSSVTSGFSQIPSIVRNFTVISAGSGWTEADITAGLNSAPVKAINYSKVGAVIDARSIANLNTIYSAISGSITLGTGEQLRDMGKELRFSVNGRIVAIWRKVQLISGVITGGVPGNYNSSGEFYIATFSADRTAAIYDTPVVSRLG